MKKFFEKQRSLRFTKKIYRNRESDKKRLSRKQNIMDGQTDKEINFVIIKTKVRKIFNKNLLFYTVIYSM